MNHQLTATMLARASETTVHTVRHYTRKGLLTPIRDPGNRYHLYRPKDIERLRFIWQAQRLGFGLKEIREILAHSETGESPCPRVREILRQRVQQNRRQLDAIVALQMRMEQALAQWQAMPDGIPNGDSVCYLIESFSED
jgi:DNA-binding transcriptional MerR regulator